MLQDLVSILLADLNQYSALGVYVTVVVFAVYILAQVRGWQRQTSRERRAELQQRAEERRNDQIFAMQRIRLTETNLATKDRIRVIDSGSVSPIASFDLQLSNIGDGPIDILCALMSGRMLDSTKKPGIATRARNVEWADHRSFYWNDRDANGLFSGISTTKSMISSADQYLRL
jgi:hypothetical protein